MFLGIDLGTSNSAIVGHDGANLRVFKTAEGTESLPSAIMIDRRGSMLVGRRAYDQAAYSPENVALGFKRLMGTASTIEFPSSSHVMTPEEASAEVLKALVGQARMIAGDFIIEGTVVTVPAAFNQMQSEATMRAAGKAGLQKVALLQEPIAAAMASIANSNNKNGQFLIYDLGGGTFDVGIVQSIGGAATVIAHSGINMLGGRDFDRALVHSVVRPWLLNTFDLPEDFQKEKGYLRLIRVAQYRAELAKIALSSQPTDRIFADETQIGAKDRSRAEIYVDIEITRPELNALIEEDITRTIELCRKVLGENGYKPDDIDRVVLIGGPSRMPIVRERVSSELGIRVDLDTDPMTVVAIGAAIYAEGRDWTGVTSAPRPARASRQVAGPVDINFDYPARTADQHVRILVRTGSGVVDGMRVQVETDEGWTSGQVPLATVREIRDVPLSRLGPNRIRITVLDESGAPLREASGEFTILRTGASADGMPLMHNIAVKVVQGAIGAEKNALHVIIKKGTPLPKSGVDQFRAARDLQAGDRYTLDFELYEQADGVSDPDLNLPIGAFRLSSEHLERGDVIRRGDSVFVEWSVDSNGLLSCKLQFPSINKTYDTGTMYVSTLGHKNFDGEDGTLLAADSLEGAREDIDRLERALGPLVADEVATLRRRFERQVENLRLSHDADTRRSIHEEARLMRQDVARLQNKPEFTIAVVRGQIDEFIEVASVDILPTVDTRTNTQVHRLAGLAKDALQRGGPHAAEEAQRSFDEIKALIFTEVMKLPEFWTNMFQDLAVRRHLAIDKSRHDSLVRSGESALARGDIAAVREAAVMLRDNMIKSVETRRISILAGLMR
jgi:molecular chaperone DnaK